MLRVHCFSFLTNKNPLALAAIAPLGIVIVKKLKNVLYYTTICYAFKKLYLMCYFQKIIIKF